MQLSRRLALTALLTTIAATTGCGGQENATQHGGFPDPASSEAKGGSSKSGGSSPASISATPTLVDRNSPLTFSLNPGSYASQMLFIKWQCYQNGNMLAYDGSDELKNAAATGVAGYAVDGSNLEWTIVVSQATNYNLVAGVGASCDMQAWYENRRLQWFQIASGTFDVSP